MVSIECTRGNDTKFHLEGEFKVQGKESLMNKTIRELCRLRGDGVDPKLIDTQKIIDELVPDRPRVNEDENEVPKKVNTQNYEKILSCSAMKLLMNPTSHSIWLTN